jgi:Kef-type K+ transport system membrane component KefB/nucleotide-binding universal stress UspA family protein
MADLVHEPLPRFLLQAAIIIASARLLGLLTRRIGQPSVIAEIVAGVLLGPSLLGLVAPGVSAAVFPPESMALMGTTSQIGLALFMFLVGLELDPRLLRGNGRASVVISHTSIIVPFVLGLGLAWYLAPSLSDESVPFASFALFMGAAMSITAFPVLARILTERRILRTRVGSVTIACAAVDDVTAWCMLAFVVSMVRSTGMMDAVITTVLALAYIVAMLLGVRKVLARLGTRVQSREGLTHDIVGVVFVFLFLSSLATELIGIHALFGAFMLGVIMPREGGLTAAMAERLEDLVVVFLLPLFFAYSGLRTEIGLLSSLSDWLVCALVIVIACAGKFGGSTIAARLCGLRWREASALGILMNTRGLMELIVLNIGLDLGVISPRLFTMMVIMALVTTFMTTPILERVFPTTEMTKDFLESAATSQITMATPAEFRLLVCVANPETGPGLVRLAAAMTRAETSRIFALRLTPPQERTSTYLEGESTGSSPRVGLGPLTRQARKLGIDLRPLSFVSARPADDICRVAEIKEVDLVVLGHHRPVLGAKLLGGVVHEVMEHAETDVAVLFDRGLAQVRRVLVPYCGGRHDIAALGLALRLAQHADTEIVLLHVVAPDRSGPRERRMETLADEVFAGAPEARNRVVFKVLVQHDRTQAVLSEVDRGFDLLVVGADDDWGLGDRTFALRSERILRESPVSIVVIRAGNSSTLARTGMREVEPATPEVPRGGA